MPIREIFTDILQTAAIRTFQIYSHYKTETSMRDFLVPSPSTHFHLTQPIVLNSPDLLGASLKNEKILVAPAMAVVTLICGM